MDTKDTGERTVLAPKRGRAGESKPEDPVPSVPLSGHEDDSLGSLGAASSELHVRTLEGNAKDKDTGDGGAKNDREGENVRTNDVSSAERPSERAPGATEHPAASSPMATTLQATHRATSSPTTTPTVAEGTGFTGMPYPTHGVEPLATEPPMAPPISEWPLARPTSVSTSRPLLMNLVPFIVPLLVRALLQCLAIPCQSLVP